MAKPNYRFDKRQRELRKAQAQEEKRLKKLARASGTPDSPAPEGGEAQPADADSPSKEPNPSGG